MDTPCFHPGPFAPARSPRQRDPGERALLSSATALDVDFEPGAQPQPLHRDEDATLGSKSPVSTIPADHFSARWTGKLKAPNTGLYTFYTQADDNARLWVNGQLLIDQWTGSAASASATISLTAGTSYNVKLEYVEQTAAATMKLSWSGPKISKPIIPSSDSGVINLTAGSWYSIRLEYQHASGTAAAALSWSTATAAKTVIAPTALRDR